MHGAQKCLTRRDKRILIQPQIQVKLVRPGQDSCQDIPLPDAEICKELSLIPLFLTLSEVLLFALLRDHNGHKFSAQILRSHR